MTTNYRPLKYHYQHHRKLPRPKFITDANIKDWQREAWRKIRATLNFPPDVILDVLTRRCGELAKRYPDASTCLAAIVRQFRRMCILEARYTAYTPGEVRPAEFYADWERYLPATLITISKFEGSQVQRNDVAVGARKLGCYISAMLERFYYDGLDAFKQSVDSKVWKQLQDCRLKGHRLCTLCKNRRMVWKDRAEALDWIRCPVCEKRIAVEDPAYVITEPAGGWHPSVYDELDIIETESQETNKNI